MKLTVEREQSITPILAPRRDEPSPNLRFIPSNPFVDPALFLRRPARRLPPPLEADNVRLFGFARRALLEGLQLLGIKAGDNALLPSLICNVAMAPFNELSIESRFYQLNSKLQPVFDSVVANLDQRTRVFLAVNYFGFPQDFQTIRDFCRVHELYFVEDNAHGFLSCSGDRYLGTFGDIAIVSIRKTLGLPYGAALIVNNPEIVDSRPSRWDNERPRSPLLFVARSVLANLEARTGLGIVDRLQQIHRRGNSARHDANDAEEASTLNYRQSWPRFSDMVVRRIRPEEIARVRRQAFRIWMDCFNGNDQDRVKPIFTELAPGVVPYAFPLTGRSYESLIATMLHRGIQAFRWPALPRRSPGWSYSRQVLLMPVHTVPPLRCIA